MILSARQMEVLNELVGAEQSHARRGNDPYKMRITPLDLGGTNGSHHSATLKALVTQGLAWRYNTAATAATKVHWSAVAKARAPTTPQAPAKRLSKPTGGQKEQEGC